MQWGHCSDCCHLTNCTMHKRANIYNKLRKHFLCKQHNFTIYMLQDYNIVISGTVLVFNKINDVVQFFIFGFLFITTFLEHNWCKS